MPAWLVSGEGSLPGLQTAAFCLCLHMASSLCAYGERERERQLCDVSFYRDTNLTGPLPSFPPLLLWRPHLQIQPHWGVRALTYEIWGNTHIHSITPSKVGSVLIISHLQGRQLRHRVWWFARYPLVASVRARIQTQAISLNSHALHHNFILCFILRKHRKGKKSRDICDRSSGWRKGT